MKVYAYWNSSDSSIDGQAEFLRIWERSWRKQGWEPRLLTIANARTSKNYRPSNSFFDNMMWALQSVGGGWLSSVLLFNNNFKPNTPEHPTASPWCLVYADRKNIDVLSSPITCRNILFHRFASWTVTRWHPEGYPVVPGCLLFDGLSELLNSGVCQ